LLGFHRLGELALEEIEAAVPVAAVYEPSRDAAKLYDEMFVQFVRIFKKNRDVFRALNVGS
jgi:xylulokinase